jgi:hypothetical protein
LVLFWPSSWCHTRIRTIYKLTHDPFIIFYFALERCPFTSIFEKPIFHSIFAFLLCLWVKQYLYISGNNVSVFAPSSQDQWNYLINASFQYSICTTLIHCLHALFSVVCTKSRRLAVTRCYQRVTGWIYFSVELLTTLLQQSHSLQTGVRRRYTHLGKTSSECILHHLHSLCSRDFIMTFTSQHQDMPSIHLLLHHDIILLLLLPSPLLYTYLPTYMTAAFTWVVTLFRIFVFHLISLPLISISKYLIHLRH